MRCGAYTSPLMLLVTPSTCKALLDAGFTINVEKSPERIFSDEEFSNIGASLVPEGSWPQAPQNTLIIGLKELPEESCMYVDLLT